MIVVSFVGYKNVETVWNGTDLRIILKSNTEELDEIVKQVERHEVRITNLERYHHNQ